MIAKNMRKQIHKHAKHLISGSTPTFNGGSLAIEIYTVCAFFFECMAKINDDISLNIQTVQFSNFFSILNQRSMAEIDRVGSANLLHGHSRSWRIVYQV